jgi:hypothetical protein
MKNRPVLSALERHCSLVSLLLIAGASLIIFQGPVGAVYRHAPTVSRASAKTDSPGTAAVPKYGVTNSSSITSTASAASPSTPDLGELPGAGAKADTSAVSK